MEGGRGGYLARLVLDPQRPLVCWPVGEGGCRRRFVLRADNLVSCVVIPNELRLELRV
jgi:hypothetical protein